MKGGYIFILTLILSIISFLLGRYIDRPVVTEYVDRIEYDTLRVTDVKYDTVWRDRVVYRNMPVIKDERDTIVIVDTVTVGIPIYNYRFADKEFRIDVEGYDVKLNDVQFYPHVEYKIKEVKVPNRWGLGIQAGYGVSREGLSPYVGIGISYNIFTW